MKKALIASLLIVVLLAAGAIGYVIVFANSFVQGYKPQIEAQLTRAVGAPVSFEDVEVSLLPSLEVRVENLSIQDPKGSGSTVTLQALRAEASLIPLLSKQLVIKRITLDTPTITIVKGRGAGANQGSASPATPPPVPPIAAQPAGAPAGQASTPMSLLIDRVLITNGTLSLPAQGSQPPLTISAIQLDAGIVVAGQKIEIPSLSLRAQVNSSLPLTLSAANASFSQPDGAIVFSSAKLETTAGSLIVDGDLNAQSTNGSLKISSGGFDLAVLAKDLQAVVPAVKVYSLKGRLNVDGTVTLQQGGPALLALNARPVDVSAQISPTLQASRLNGLITGSGPTSNLAVASNGLALRLNEVPLKADAALNVTPQGVKASTLTISGFGGRIASPVTFSNGPPSSFSASPSASKVDLEQLFNAFSPQVSKWFVGNLDSLTSTVSGGAGQPVRAEGILLVTNASLKGTNLPMEVLNALGQIPLFSGLLAGGLPENYKSSANIKDTPIREMKGSFSFAQGQTTLKNVQVASDMCSFTVDGTIAPDGALDISSTVTFSPDLSMGLVRSFKGLNRALNSAQQLVVPVRITGKSPMLVVLPDVTKLITGTLTNLPSEALGVIGGALGLKGGDGSGSGKNGGSKQKSGGLGGILGF